MVLCKYFLRTRLAAASQVKGYFDNCGQGEGFRVILLVSKLTSTHAALPVVSQKFVRFAVNSPRFEPNHPSGDLLKGEMNA